MKLSGFDDIDPGVRSFILIAVAIAFPAWDFGFEIGAFGRLFFEKIFFAWSISTALLIVLLFIPRNRLQIPRIAWFATAIPSFWLVLAITTRLAPDDQVLRLALTVFGFIAYLACFPYVIYMAISIAYPELIRLGRAGPRVGVSVIVLFMAAAGYISGSNHSRLLTCEDFEISGHFVPENCGRKPTN